MCRHKDFDEKCIGEDSPGEDGMSPPKEGEQICCAQFPADAVPAIPAVQRDEPRVREAEQEALSQGCAHQPQLRGSGAWES